MASDPELEGGRRQPPRRSGRRRRLLWVTLTLLAVVLGSGVGYAAYLHQLLVSNIASGDLLPDGPVQTDAAAARGGATELGADHPASSLPVRLPDTGLNVLVIGSDKEVAGPGWSDAIFLAHVAQNRDHVLVVRLPRDLHVAIPGRAPDTLRTAYIHGGAKLLAATAQNLLGIVIDHVAVTGFAGFRAMTDAVDGVDVQVSEPGVWPGYTFRPGITHMDGEMALAFVRERTGGDAARGTRQQAFLEALTTKSLSAGVLTNPVRLAALLDAATENLTVDRAFTVGEMTSLAVSLRALRSGDISFVQAPVAGPATSAPQDSALLVDVPRMRALGDALRADRVSDVPGQ